MPGARVLLGAAVAALARRRSWWSSSARSSAGPTAAYGAARRHRCWRSRSSPSASFVVNAVAGADAEPPRCWSRCSPTPLQVVVLGLVFSALDQLRAAGRRTSTAAGSAAPSSSRTVGWLVAQIVLAARAAHPGLRPRRRREPVATVSAGAAMTRHDCYCPVRDGSAEPPSADTGDTSQGDPWHAVRVPLVGCRFYGLIGWALDRWLGTSFLVVGRDPARCRARALPDVGAVQRLGRRTGPLPTIDAGAPDATTCRCQRRRRR